MGVLPPNPRSLSHYSHQHGIYNYPYTVGDRAQVEDRPEHHGCAIRHEAVSPVVTAFYTMLVAQSDKLWGLGQRPRFYSFFNFFG